MAFRLFGILVSASLLAACAEQNADVSEPSQVAVEPGVSWQLAESRAAVLSNINYTLTFRVAEDPTAPITAFEVASFTLASARDDLQFDFRESADKIHAVTVNGAAQTIDHRAEHLVIPASSLQVGGNVVEIDFTAGDTSLNRSPEFLYTLFVPDRARTAFPVFDQPNLKATYKLTLDVPASWQALSNAPLVQTTEATGRLIYEFENSDLLSTYLFSFVAGKFETETRVVDGREMSLLHRETDASKTARNLDAIFQLHADALTWLEDYTGIAYPFKKFDFAAIPAFQYGGMEHAGAIQYRASSLFLDESPSETQLLNRASLIAHETAHMWFGDLVTMNWFDDVWTKEVFANFMASKIVNPSFPSIDHELNFLLSRYPAAYSVDRTEGANAIRQHLPNLNEAGTLYGAIIYNKAPIMMRQLEALLGEEVFRQGMRDYLAKFADSNATWPDLIEILDQKTNFDLKAWSEVWVNTPGRPDFRFDGVDGQKPEGVLRLRQHDRSGQGRFWPQQFSLSYAGALQQETAVTFASPTIDIGRPAAGGAEDEILLNANGMGYGLFPASVKFAEQNWLKFNDLQKGAVTLALFEAMQENDPAVRALEYAQFLLRVSRQEQNELLLDALLGQLNTIFWSFLSADEQRVIAGPLEAFLWSAANDTVRAASTRKVFFNRFRSMATTPDALEKLHGVWAESISLEGLSFSVREQTALAAVLAVKMPQMADQILAEQLGRIENPDQKARFEFLMPALSADEAVRDAFFASLALEENRERENWVLVALAYLHHPLRIKTSEKYILPSLELLEDIQRTGDIFFPAGWTARTLAAHNSDIAVKTVRQFLEDRPNYNRQLRLKILQAADRLFRANRILGAG